MPVAGLSPHILGSPKSNPPGQSGTCSSPVPTGGCSVDAKQMVILKHTVPLLGTGINY